MADNSGADKNTSLTRETAPTTRLLGWAGGAVRRTREMIRRTERLWWAAGVVALLAVVVLRSSPVSEQTSFSVVSEKEPAHECLQVGFVSGHGLSRAENSRF